jgi:hypothetical protein
VLAIGGALAPCPSRAGIPPGKQFSDGASALDDLNRAYSETFSHTLKGGSQPNALPDIYGPGSVLKAGNVVMKVTNIGILGNPFTTSSDPSGQWPGASGVEYLFAMQFAVGGVENINGQIVRRVSYSTEWRPPSLDAEDKIYAAYDGILGGGRYQDDDGDGKIDEDFLDGRDNDGDGLIDEDHAALGQQEFSCVMTDFSIQSLTANVREQHVPLGLRVEQKAWAYSLTSPNLTNFNVIEYKIINVSGNTIDSLFAGWQVDFDAGPVTQSNYFGDDQDIPWYPQGWFIYDWTQGGSVNDARTQLPHSSLTRAAVDSPLCSRDTIFINGFSFSDDNGDDGRTPGVPSLLLFNHTIDPLGVTGPRRVQFRAYRSYVGGTPYNQGGNPTLDQQRFELMSGFALGPCCENIETDPTNPMYGFITQPQGDQKGDYAAWCSVGPWLSVHNNQSVTVTIGMAIDRGSLLLGNAYKSSYLAYLNAPDEARGGLGKFLLDTYPSLNNAFTAQLAYEGVWDRNLKFARTDFHGRETPLIADPGQQYTVFEECGDASRQVLVTDRQLYWFDFDCDYCTGVWDYLIGNANPNDPSAGGLMHKTWNSSSPPPSPVTNASITYNFSANPDRKYVPAGNNSVLLAWDNLSELTPDPAPPNVFDFRGYKIWKVADWTRPVGSPGPAEEDWSLVADFRLFDYYDNNGNPIPNNYSDISDPLHPVCGDSVYIPSLGYKKQICLKRGDLWNLQTGEIIHPNDSLVCAKDAQGNCLSQTGCIIPPSRGDCTFITRIRYPVGRYSFTDYSVKNGFMYFYSVTAYDSSGNGMSESRRSAVEAEGVVPQAATGTGKSVWVVPNPYRGYAAISQRPSSWDLTPNATDPTGTHIDFLGLPQGKWTIKIFTVSGDLVQTIHSDDPVNESVRGTIASGGSSVPGYNRQQDNPNDGEARWNLISRNGQDIVSGIYLFTVDSSEGIQRGKFVIIR